MSIFWMKKRILEILLLKHHKNTKNHGNRRKQTYLNKQTESARFTSFPRNGSLTVEAAFVIPVFCFLVTAMLSFFFLFIAETKLQNSMEAVASRMAAYCYVIDELNEAPLDETEEGEENETEYIEQIENTFGEVIINIPTQLILGELVKTEMSNNLISYPVIKDGIEGISFLGSGFDEDEQLVKIVASYQLIMPFFPDLGSGISISQQCVQRAWTGKYYDNEADDDPWVYVTANGTVYHTESTCTHIRLTIRSVSFAEIGNKRNDSGAVYTACYYCGSEHTDTVYITTSGDRYHSSKNCSGLKREVKTIRLSEVGDLPLCQRCRENGEGGD